MPDMAIKSLSTLEILAEQIVSLSHAIGTDQSLLWSFLTSLWTCSSMIAIYIGELWMLSKRGLRVKVGPDNRSKGHRSNYSQQLPDITALKRSSNLSETNHGRRWWVPQYRNQLLGRNHWSPKTITRLSKWRKLPSAESLLETEDWTWPGEYSKSTWKKKPCTLMPPDLEVTEFSYE